MVWKPIKNWNYWDSSSFSLVFHRKYWVYWDSSTVFDEKRLHCAARSSPGQPRAIRGSPEQLRAAQKSPEHPRAAQPLPKTTYLKRFSKRHQRRNEVVDKGSSESNIWVLRLLVCGPGFTSSIWESVVRETIEGMNLFWTAHLNQMFGHSARIYVGMELSALFKRM